MQDFDFLVELARFAKEKGRSMELRASAGFMVVLLLLENEDYFRGLIETGEGANEHLGQAEKQMVKLVSERNWLAHHLVRGCSSFTCPMPRDFVCEHRNNQSCESGSPIENRNCWIQAAMEGAQEHE